jgi:hypothetical protein
VTARQAALFSVQRASDDGMLRTGSVRAVQSQPLSAAERMRRTRARRRGDPGAPDPQRPGPKRRPAEPVRTVATSNAALIAAAARLYITDGATVADVTYGRGTFWRRTDLTRFRLLASDLHPHHDRPCVQADFRHLPYAAGTIDTVVLDPPYLHSGGAHESAARFGLSRGPNLYHDQIMALYLAGMTEARRVLRPAGQLWVKCKDQVQREVQCWSHVELHATASQLGFTGRDLFVLVAAGTNGYDRWPVQRHARKTHSFMWIFEAP